MAKQKINVEIQGITPLLMHRFPIEPVEAIEKKPPEEQAEIAAYRTPDGELYIPGTNIQRALVGGATYCKGKGRASLKKPAAACLFVTPEYVILDPQTYVVDTRPVVMPSTKGRILRHRPKLEQWRVGFVLEYDDTLLSDVQIREIVDNA